MLQRHFGDLANLVVVLVLMRCTMRRLDFFPSAHVESPVGQERDVVNLVAHFDAEHMELQTQPERERRRRMAHGFKAKELLVEAPRFGNVAAFQRAVS